LNEIIFAIAAMACIIYAGSMELRADPNDMYWWLRAWGIEKLSNALIVLTKQSRK
jgi:hypothetical protein